MSGAPDYSFTPNFFQPSSTPCDLPVTDETKSRLAIGGTFFRSRATGNITNLIYIQGSLVQTAPLTYNYVLTAVQKDPQTFQNVAKETFSVPYENTPNLPTVSPPGPPQFPTILAAPSPSILALRVKVNEGSQLIEMPTPGQDYLFKDNFDNNVLSVIAETALRGGNGAPIPPDPAFYAIRTGPSRLLSYIIHLDVGYALINVNQMQEWNGSAWVPYQRISAIG